MNNGEPEGLSRSYYPNGQLKAEVELRRGKIVKRRYWDEAGKVAAPQANPVLAQQGARAQKRARAAVAIWPPSPTTTILTSQGAAPPPSPRDDGSVPTPRPSGKPSPPPNPPRPAPMPAPPPPEPQASSIPRTALGSSSAFAFPI